jgi:hypothetical protein
MVVFSRIIVTIFFSQLLVLLKREKPKKLKFGIKNDVISNRMLKMGKF